MNTLEVCCGSLASALAAVEGGAERIELCSALSLDGLTPTIGLLRELRSLYPHLKIHVLIRPREGDFVYSEAEIRVMERDIHEAVAAGATAIVSGALTPDNAIDLTTTARLVHADPFAALEQLRSLGVTRILTSGCAPTAEVGIPLLCKLMKQGVIILPGGGVNSHNAQRILKETGATEIHGSCSTTLSNGLRHTSADEVRAILKAIS